MEKLKSLVEWNVFGVCTAIGLKLGISTSRIRQYFLYTAVMTLGSPIILYMILAFWRDVRKYMQSTRRNPWHSL
ncbi:MAG: PspC family transcriptional regulator [Bacteroidota bacterium]|jgi:phage shock protein PspC (stress-responsive transcriptional regulator)